MSSSENCPPMGKVTGLPVAEGGLMVETTHDGVLRDAKLKVFWWVTFYVEFYVARPRVRLFISRIPNSTIWEAFQIQERRKQHV
jgi:hypothetical protein